MELVRPKISKEQENSELLDKTLPNLHITRPRDKPKAKKTSTGAPESTIKYKSYGDPHPNILKVNLFNNV